MASVQLLLLLRLRAFRSNTKLMGGVHVINVKILVALNYMIKSWMEQFGPQCMSSGCPTAISDISTHSDISKLLLTQTLNEIPVPVQKII